MARSSRSSGRFGATIARSLAFGASTPWNLMRRSRGRGAALAVVDLRTTSGREDSMIHVLRNLRQGNVV